MKDIMIDCYLAAKTHLNPNKRKNCFELLGLDFLLDEDFRLWLLEVNNNPHLGMPSKFMEDLIGRMINDMLKITLDPMYKPVIINNIHGRNNSLY
jgi:tubulin--tyrosine ligase